MTIQTRRSTSTIDRIRSRRRAPVRTVIQIDQTAVSALAEITATIAGVKTPNGTTRKIARIASAAQAA